MKISQYVYFALKSETILPSELARRVGFPGDREAARGTRTADPPRPVLNTWEIRCEERGLTVTEQVERVISRVMPRLAAIRQLIDDGEVMAVLQIVRYLDDQDGEEEQITRVGDLEKLGGQHQLLGWHLDRSVVRFLDQVDAGLDVDEYG
jgi:Domain of unknown function (DUF4279)